MEAMELRDVGEAVDVLLQDMLENGPGNYGTWNVIVGENVYEVTAQKQGVGVPTPCARIDELEAAVAAATEGKDRESVMLRDALERIKEITSCFAGDGISNTPCPVDTIDFSCSYHIACQALAAAPAEEKPCSVCGGKKLLSKPGFASKWPCKNCGGSGINPQKENTP